MHPSESIRGETSRLLEGKRIILAVTGSIACVKSVELARELIRHGATVLPVMTKAATELLHPNALEFATGVKPVTTLTGATEHVTELGYGQGKADLLLIAPCTGNTLSKMALGIDDTPVTTYFTTGFTTTPTLVAPAMHSTMWAHPFLQENLERLKRHGVHVLEPFFEEGKAKLPEPEVIVEHALRLLSGMPLKGKRILVINGSTVEPIDEMRVVTNKSTGRTGVALAREAFRLGAEVEHWFGHGHVDALPRHLPMKRFVTVADLLQMLPDVERFDYVFMPAAISDFGPAPASGKISSDAERVTLELQPLPKVVKQVRERTRGTLIAFKAESGVTEKALVEKARKSIQVNGAKYVVANDLRGVGVDATSVLLVDERNVRPLTGTKDEVARQLLLAICQEGGAQ
ncbi:MAG TPA: bifunctional phosphopantothenoylcysteine decarboxylase/phosphopantothenate--cysteine ligase CoaBC [Candidatus Thermoplasmatota archaeon]|nr:bifunctional phosphopantothenoylcysteine decarboxylase/phosphopantothenate--cysteine ligase CoaBC [Candidatus Thermoplasmatota archaeon]